MMEQRANKGDSASPAYYDACKTLLRGSPYLQTLYSNLIPLIQLQMKVCNMAWCIPFSWDENKKCIAVSESKWKLRMVKFQIGIHYAYALFMLVYLLLTPSLNKLSTNLLGFVFLSCLLVTMLMRSEIWLKRMETIMLWDALKRVEERYIDQMAIKKVKKDKISLVMMTLGVCTSFGLPGFMCALLLVDPCKPPHLGYILFKVSRDTCAMNNFVIRISFLLFDTWFWFIAISQACFYVFHSMFLGLRCLDLYLRLLLAGFKNPLQNEVFKTQDDKDKVVFRLYLEFQIVIKLYNRVYQAVFLPSLVATAIFVIIVCLFATIKLHGVIPMPGFAFFPLLSSDGFSVIYVARVASVVYIQSRLFVTTLQKSSRYTRRTWFRKRARSLYIMKIRFGSTNFIDEMTPLVFLDFSFSQTASLMLVT